MGIVSKRLKYSKTGLGTLGYHRMQGGKRLSRSLKQTRIRYLTLLSNLNKLRKYKDTYQYSAFEEYVKNIERNEY